jgi:ABC-type sugar transport system ATPase subunit
MIYVTHDQVEAMTMADKIAVMRGGRILQFGTPAGLYTQPATLDVARTLGTPGIGVLRATVRGASRGLATASGFVLPLAVNAVDATEGASVSVGLRAEHLVLTGIGQHGALPARVLHVECLGADTLVHVGLYGADVSAAANVTVPGPIGKPHRAQSESQPRLIVRTARGLSDLTPLPRPGDAVGVLPDLSRALVFDETGRRIAHDMIASGAAATRQFAHG